MPKKQPVKPSGFPNFLLWLSIIIFIVFFSYVAFSRHDNFHSRRLDMGNMEQTVWNVTHGNGFTLTDPTGTGQISRLAVHADFLLILVAPLYMLWQDAKLLLLVQTVIVGLGALPLYWIAKDTLKDDFRALVFPLLYLLYPPLQHIVLHDFHAVALSTTFLLFAYWYMVKERYVLFTVFAVLAALGKEHVWIATGLMGLYIVFRNKKVLLGSVVTFISFGMFYYLFWHAIPSVTPAGQHFALSYLSEFGETTSGVVFSMIRQPVRILETVFMPDRLEYYYRLLLPVAFLPVLSPLPLIFAAHSLLINILSTNGHMRMIDYQYNSDIIPFLFIAAVYGFRRLQSMLGQPVMRMVLAGILVVAGISSYMWGEIPLTREDRFYYFIWPLPEKQEMQRVEQLIGPMYTVSATNDIGAHFARRQYLYNFPINAMTADFAVVRLGDFYAWPSGTEQKRVVEELLMSPDHELIASEGAFYAFRKK